MGPINLIEMHSPLTVAHLFTWALLAAAIFILEEQARLIRDLAEAWAAEEGKTGLRRDGVFISDTLERLEFNNWLLHVAS